MRAKWLPLLLMPVAACESAIVEHDGAARLSLNITVAAGVALGNADAGRVRITGPTSRVESMTPGTTRTFEGLEPGTYTVSLEALTGGELEAFGERSNVNVTAGQNTTVNVTLSSFVPVVTVPATGAVNQSLAVQFTGISGADAYELATSTDPGFSGAQTTSVSGTSATIQPASAGRWYVRVRARNRFGTWGRWSSARSVDILQVMYTVSLNGAGNGSGTVTSTDGGIQCMANNSNISGDCGESYPQGTQVTLTATATAGSTFGGWSGSCTNQTGPCHVSMTQDRTVTATFTSFGPQAPSDLTATVVSPTSIRLLWTDNSSNETSFQIESWDGSTWVFVASTPGNVTNFTEAGLVPDVTYQYRVRACLAGPCSNYSNVASATPSAATELQNGVSVSGLGGAAQSERHFRIFVPAGQTRLQIRTTSGSGDLDLFVRFQGPAGVQFFDCKDESPFAIEICTISNPTSGYWYVMVLGFSDYSGVDLTASYGTSSVPTPPVLSGMVTTWTAVNDCLNGSLTGTNLTVTFNYSDANGDVPVPVEVWYAFAYSLSRNGTFQPAGVAQTGNGSSGTVSFTLCHVFLTDNAVIETVRIQDSQGLPSNYISFTTPRPAGASVANPGGALRPPRPW